MDAPWESPQKHILFNTYDKICMMMTRLACNQAIENSYWRMDNNLDVGLHVIFLDNTSLRRGVTRFAWWWQDLHAIELLRAHIGEWTITRMLDYWWVMCLTSYWLNWNPWIWIPFPIDSDCTLLCAQVDRTRYSSIASSNNCIVQLCKCVPLHL
jgi:hypothetical protein